MQPTAIRFRMIVEWWERFVLAFVALLGAMALFSFGSHVWDAGASRSPDGSAFLAGKFISLSDGLHSPSTHLDRQSGLIKYGESQFTI